MAGTTAPEIVPEPQLNRLLRGVDWRFLLRQEDAPRIADLTRGRASRAVRLVAAEVETEAGAADVALIGYPTRRSLRAALEALRPGGEIVCLWLLPRLAGGRRAATRLRGAGFADVSVLWPGPAPNRAPQFWLPLDSPAAIAHLLARRPPRSRAQALLRGPWRAIARAGLLSPLCAVGRLPGEGGPTPVDEIEATAPATAAWLLLTGGDRSINKVVGLPIADAAGPAAVVKFARVPEADAALDREAAALRSIEEERPHLSGVPRLRRQGRRAGRRALVETAIHGTPLISRLTPASFGELAAKVTEWLIELAGRPEPRPAREWWQRLAGEPLAAFERDFGNVAEAEAAARARRLLEGLEELPLVPEHRDCSPWNVVLTAEEAPALLDWESAEPHGLPGLDLAYFLANAAFVLDGALESGRTRQSYERLLDPATPYGRIAARCTAEYGERLHLPAEAFSRLRLLAWLVHSRSDFRHLAMEGAERPSPEALRGATFLGLAELELTLIEDR